MREIAKLPIFTARRRRITVFLAFVLSLPSVLIVSGCSIRRTVKATIPLNMRNAKTASYDELLALIASYDRIQELSSNDLRLRLVVGKQGSETQDQFRPAPGYILLRRPDSVHLVLKSPLGTELDMLSVGDDLSAWVPSKNRFYIGKNSAKELVSDDLPKGFTLRGTHIFEAVFPQSVSLDSPGIRISMEEAEDAGSKYYTISFYRDLGSRRIHTIRRIWIERSQLAIVRLQRFLDDGRVESDIEYSNMEQIDGSYLPLKIHANRPQDGYDVSLEFKSGNWRINNNLPDEAFVLKPPEGAEIIHLKEKI